MTEKEPNIYEQQSEEEEPTVLYRAFTVNPEMLTLDILTKNLTPGTISKDDHKKIGDGNELGVYMSTNSKMVEYAYANTSIGLHIKSPRYQKRGYPVMDYIPLPQCGVIVEINTTNLQIRKPQISKVLKEVYNNQFEGDEWIADIVPSSNYKVVKLTLSSHANDINRFEVRLEDDSKEALEVAIEKIKEEFQKKKKEAFLYKHFLEQLDEKMRLNGFVLQRRWEKFKEDGGN